MTLLQSEHGLVTLLVEVHRKDMSAGQQPIVGDVTVGARAKTISTLRANPMCAPTASRYSVPNAVGSVCRRVRLQTREGKTLAKGEGYVQETSLTCALKICESYVKVV